MIAAIYGDYLCTSCQEQTPQNAGRFDAKEDARPMLWRRAVSNGCCHGQKHPGERANLGDGLDAYKYHVID